MIDIYENGNEELTLSGLNDEQQQHVRSLVEQWNNGKVPERLFAVTATASRIDTEGKKTSNTGIVLVTRDSNALVSAMNRYYDLMEPGAGDHYLNISRSKGGNIQMKYHSVSSKNDATGYKYEEEVDVTPIRLDEHDKRDLFQELQDNIGVLF